MKSGRNRPGRRVSYRAQEKGTERAFTASSGTLRTQVLIIAPHTATRFQQQRKFRKQLRPGPVSLSRSARKHLYAPDNSYGMKRTEVMCGRCKVHFGSCVRMTDLANRIALLHQFGNPWILKKPGTPKRSLPKAGQRKNSLPAVLI